MEPESVLSILRGTDEICGCGRRLIKIEGGVTHETLEDEDYHVEYFRNLKVN